MTPGFWRALDRLGSDGAAAADWRHHMGTDWEAGRAHLRRTHRLAGTVIHPDRPHRRLLVEPEGEAGYVGIADDTDDLHAPVPLALDDIEVLAPDWDSLTVVLARAFNFAGNRWEHAGHTRKIGVAQHGSDMARPVILCLPPGHIMRQTVILGGLASRKDSTVLMPSSRGLSPEIDALAVANGLTLIGLAEQCEKTGIREDSAPYLATPAVGKGASRAIRPVLRAQSAWTWEMVTIEIATGGRLIFSCDDQRQSYRLPKSKGTNHSESYEILFNLAFASPQEWRTPASTEEGSDTTRRRFGRLRNQLKAWVSVPGDPFRKLRDRVYVPRFRVVPHADLASAAAETRGRMSRD